MADTKVQAPGQFCWCDLSTPDIDAAKKFYSELFGWTLNDVPAGEAGTYTMARVADGDVCGMAQMPEQVQAQNVPPHWLSYVKVESADGVTEKVKELGGQVRMEPLDVMDVGRMSVIADPAGAVCAIWEPKSHSSTMVMGQPNSSCWFECISTNKSESGAFYSGLFGWELESFPGGMDYTMFKQGDVSTGGLMQTTPEMGEVPSHWMVYFAVDDCDAMVKKAEGLGAKTLHPPTDIPMVGRFSVIQDPTGAVFSIIKLQG